MIDCDGFGLDKINSNFALLGALIDKIRYEIGQPMWLFPLV